MRAECYSMHVYCDTADCDSFLETAEPTKARSYREARRLGWRLGKKDKCPVCVAGNGPWLDGWGAFRENLRADSSTAARRAT